MDKFIQIFYMTICKYYKYTYGLLAALIFKLIWRDIQLSAWPASRRLPLPLWLPGALMCAFRECITLIQCYTRIFNSSERPRYNINNKRNIFIHRMNKFENTIKYLITFIQKNLRLNLLWLKNNLLGPLFIIVDVSQLVP